MNLNEIIRKAAEGLELSPAERQALKEFRPDGIPKSRLDNEIARRKELEKNNSQLAGQVQQLNSKVDALESRDLSETERIKKNHGQKVDQMQKDISELTRERDSARKQLESLHFRQKINQLAAKHRFDNADFLEYLIRKDGVAIEDEEQVESFIDELKQSNPKHFRVEVRSGAGSKIGTHETGFATAEKSGDIAGMLENAPEIRN
ncbi:hypothetical protein P0136_01385 [Lentisphaerota bacterium ZTH]|nr:hypothetical protein JYG24_07475 [Lentisphaerota bacterium]WET06667.1 hypothetical protein P0136_01385 [Lentisphaerota bacterium ZTH]